MKRPCSKQIARKIGDLKAGSVFTWRDFENAESSPGAIKRALSRLESEQKIRRRTRGVYFVPSETVLGPRRIPDEHLLEKLLLEKRARDESSFGDERVRINRLVPVGAALFYELGLTTQVPARKTFISSVAFPEESRSLRVQQVPMEKYKDLSDPELRAYLALVDLNKVSNESPAEVARAYVRYLRSERISRKRLRAITAELGGQKGRRALKNLEFVESVVWPKAKA
jgi:hypothetical protein